MNFLETINIGLLYNGFVSATLVAISFIVAMSIGHRRRYFGRDDQLYMKYLSHFWGMMGFMWLFYIIHLWSLWTNNQALNTIFYTGFLIIFSLQIVYLFLYILSVLFKRYTFSSFLFFLSILIPGLFLFFIFIEGIDFVGNTGWSGVWAISEIAGLVLRYCIFVPIIGLMFLIFLREGMYLFFEKRDKFNKKVLYTLFPLGAYLFIILPDIIGLNTGWLQVLMRIIIVGCAFITYLIYSGRQDIAPRHAGYMEDMVLNLKVKYPILAKSSLFTLIVTVIPLCIAGLLLAYSFQVVFEQIILGNDELLSNTMWQQIVILITLMSVVAFFVSLILSRTIAVRLRLLFNGTREIARGNFDFRIKDIGGSDEISLLGALFNSISEYLKRYQFQIQEYGENLEHEVEEQTQELAQKTKEADMLASQQKELFEQLQTSSNYITDAMGDGVLVLDKDNKVTTLNKAFLNYFKIHKDTVLHKNILEIKALYAYTEIGVSIEELHNKGEGFVDVSLDLQPPLNGTMTCRLTAYVSEAGEKGTILVWRMENQQWGVVLDSQKREPLKLAMVRLIDQKTNKLIDTEVTDAQGRFGFLVGKGQYYVTVMKDGFHFPSKTNEGYHGEVITVENKDEGAIKSIILMDPMTEQVETFGDVSVTTSDDNVIDVSAVGELKTVEELE